MSDLVLWIREYQRTKDEIFLKILLNNLNRRSEKRYSMEVSLWEGKEPQGLKKFEEEIKAS